VKKKICLVLSLAIIAGLFCFIVFSNDNKTPESPINTEDNQTNISEQENMKQQKDLEISSSGALETDDDFEQGGDMRKDSKDSSKEKNNYDNSKTDSSHMNKSLEYTLDTSSIEESSKYYQKELKELAYTVLNSFEMNKNTAAFEYPFVGNDLHLGVKLQVFKWNGTGDDTIFRYVSDEGWLGGNAIDISNHRETLNLNLANELSTYKCVLEIKAMNLKTNMVQIYDVFWDEGSDAELICAETKME